MSAEQDPFRPDFDLTEAIDAARAAPTIEAFRATRFCLKRGDDFDRWAGAIRTGSGASPKERDAPRPARPEDPIRLVHWNIEQGKAWERILAAIDADPRLGRADLWTVNEVDVGTARAGNRNVVIDLAARLDFFWVYAACYVELLGRNRVGLHGLALLSRWPLVDPGAAPLPDCFDYFGFPEEKRLGARRILWATVAHPSGPFRIATTHLEVRNDPACRARQMKAALDALPAGSCWFTGDWNSHTFRRGTVGRSFREFLRLQTVSAREIDRQLLAPWEREPLFGEVERAGFDFLRYHDGRPTARQRLSGVEEIERLPRRLRAPARRLLRLEARTLRMRLDWIAARGPWEPAGPGAAWTGTAHGPEENAASDHAPIGVAAQRTDFAEASPVS
ncbi:MAG: hypothetical protein GF346_07720 [Candidatus Eisenbacteria bacterium]|nr:hypothetical protein [Candidatus Latescibacterota bacterium]MBD3302320.1 hypothetical protein [Candidatus Eisenbacteria bacterium]